MRSIKKIIIHCSDTPDDMEIGRKEIHLWHTDPRPNGNGWRDIGYHAVVRRDGTVEVGRPTAENGAHVRGHNHDSLGICWIGRDQPSAIQYQSLLAKVLEWCLWLDIPSSEIYGHCEFDKMKTCPNMDIEKFRNEIKEMRDED